MNLVTAAFFVGELNIPNTDRVDVSERLGLFISKYEAALLADILGYPLYKSYLADATTPRMVALISGAEFTDTGNGQLVKWPGLVPSASTSAIAAYTYYWWMRASVTQSTAIGEVQPGSDGGKTASPMLKSITAWNEVAVMVEMLVRYLQSSDTTYPEWDKTHTRRLLNAYRKLNPLGL